MPPDVGLLSILIGSNYPCLQLIFMFPAIEVRLYFSDNKTLHMNFGNYYIAGDKQLKSYQRLKQLCPRGTRQPIICFAGLEGQDPVTLAQLVKTNNVVS